MCILCVLISQARLSYRYTHLIWTYRKSVPEKALNNRIIRRHELKITIIINACTFPCSTDVVPLVICMID